MVSLLLSWVNVLNVISSTEGSLLIVTQIHLTE